MSGKRWENTARRSSGGGLLSGAMVFAAYRSLERTMKIRSFILRSYWSSGQVWVCILIARSADTPGQPPFSSGPVLEDLETGGVRARTSNSSILGREKAYDQFTKSEQELLMNSSRPSIASGRDSMVVVESGWQTSRSRSRRFRRWLATSLPWP